MSIPNPHEIDIKNGDSSMNKKSTGLYKIGSVLKTFDYGYRTRCGWSFYDRSVWCY